MIRLEAFISFQEKYVSTVTLAWQTKTSSRFLIARCENIGIELIGAFRNGKL